MTIYYPDLSQFQGGVSISGASAVCARATEGNWLVDSNYQNIKSQASSKGILQFAYHFLEGGSSAASQAAFCHSVVGKAPLMLDFEPIAGLGGTPAEGWALGSSRPLSKSWLRFTKKTIVKLYGGYISMPTVAQAVAFVDEYRKLGGTCYLLYLPNWYWQVLGSPSLQPFASRSMSLVSSAYTIYSNSGPGWSPYGGMFPKIWQYSDTIYLNGYNVDFNAYKGTVGELENLVTTGNPNPQPPPPPPPPPVPQPTYSEDSMIVLDNLQTGLGYALPVPSGKTALLLYADELGTSAPTLRIAFEYPWTMVKPTVVTWETSPIKVAVPKGATKVTLSLTSKTPAAAVTVDWA